MTDQIGVDTGLLVLPTQAQAIDILKLEPRLRKKDEISKLAVIFVVLLCCYCPCRQHVCILYLIIVVNFLTY